MVTDVFTREVATKALPNKQSGTVTQAAAEIISELVQDREGNYVVTTDQGNEFRGLEGPCRSRRCTGRSCRATGTPRR